MQKIYVVNGLPKSGKTTFGEIVGTQLRERERGINFLHTSSINPVKQILCAYDTWNESLKSVGYGVLRTLKNEVTDRDWSGREEDKDEYWRNAMSLLKAKINEWSPTLIHGLVMNEFKELGENFVGLVDIREPENIVSFRSHVLKTHKLVDSVETILVTSDGSSIFNNNSDTRINELKYDIIIENPRASFVNDQVALWFLRCRAKAFIEQEILEGRPKERHY
jgi:hypothetical protein